MLLRGTITGLLFRFAAALAIALLVTQVLPLEAQNNVTTFHYDNSRSGQNVLETTLTPSNVNSGQFGRLFSVVLDGYVYAQPLYMANISINGGNHNVLYVATEHASLYAIDADNGTLYWQLSFINSLAGVTTVPSTDVGCGSLLPEIGITSTPVIDPSTGTIYLVVATKENGSYIQRLHAIDIVSQAEKFGGPVVISATVGGTGSGSVQGEISFNPLTQNNRPALLLENAHVVIAWASFCDLGPYQGWVMSYAADSLMQEAAINLAPNGSDAGVWMSGDGVAADADGNLYLASGNGTYDGTVDYGDSIIKLGPPAMGTFPVLDWFTPYDQESLSEKDEDLGSGGVLLLPDLPDGSAHQHLLVQAGKDGALHLVDRDNMGRYCSDCNSQDSNIVQEIAGGAATATFGAPAYWNGSIYWGGSPSGSTLKQFLFNNGNSGVLSSPPSSQSALMYSWAGSPVISADGTSNGILWLLDNSTYTASCCQTLYAFDATNLSAELYNSNQAGVRDVPGGAVKFTAPVVANGHVYVGSQSLVTAYGIISSRPVAAMPIFSAAPGGYTSTIAVTLSDSTPGATIYCTTDGSTPTADSSVCTTLSITNSLTVNAIAIAQGYNNSAIASGTYYINPAASAINCGSGFGTGSGLALNGSAKLVGTRLRLTDAVTTQAGSAFATTPINVQSFITDFSFQLSQAVREGFTFTIQKAGTTALGQSGAGLGYGTSTNGGSGGIGRSVAVKFDLYNENGEGADSTGFYSNGAWPTTPAIDMTSSGVNLHGGQIYNVHLSYDGTTLMMTITDASNPDVTFTSSWVIDIPGTIGGDRAYIGFTGSTGARSAIQEILTWTYISSQPASGEPTITALSSSANPVLLNQPVTFTATVTNQSDSVLTGTVTFKNGANTMATVALVNGQASYTRTFPSTGARSITAVYSGDSNNAASASTVVNQMVTGCNSALLSVNAALYPAPVVGKTKFFLSLVNGPQPLGVCDSLAESPASPGSACYESYTTPVMGRSCGPVSTCNPSNTPLLTVTGLGNTLDNGTFQITRFVNAGQIKVKAPSGGVTLQGQNGTAMFSTSCPQ